MKKKFEISLAISGLWAVVVLNGIPMLILSDFFKSGSPFWLKIAVPAIIAAVGLAPVLLVIYADLMNKQSFVASLVIITLATAAYVYYPLLTVSQTRSNSFAVVLLVLLVIWVDRKFNRKVESVV